MSASVAQLPQSPGEFSPALQARPQRTGSERHANSAHGQRISCAFTQVEHLPALAESRRRVLALTEEPTVDRAELIAAIESDAALTLAVMRAANAEHHTPDRVDTALAAIERIGTEAVRRLATRAREFDFFERGNGWDDAPQQFRLHGLATQRVADRIAAKIQHPNRDRLALSSLLHDIGKLVLVRAYPGYPAQVHREAVLPEERIHRERRELGVDHALVGGVLLRRFGLPSTITGPIEHHHDPEAKGDGALLRVADLLAHYQWGEPVSPTEVTRSAQAIGLTAADLRLLMYELPCEPGHRRKLAEPCPLSGRELRVLQRLSEGSVYKEIALELNLSASTVRSHLNKVYRKLGARDRAQAVLIASRRGWIEE